MKPLSIVHVVRSPVGGVFRHIADLASAQKAAGHAVGLICDSNEGGALEDARLAALQPDLALGLVRLPMRRAIGPADLPTVAAVARRLASMRPDVVHAHGAKGGVYGRLSALFEWRRGRAPDRLLRTAWRQPALRQRLHLRPRLFCRGARAGAPYRRADPRIRL